MYAYLLCFVCFFLFLFFLPIQLKKFQVYRLPQIVVLHCMMDYTISLPLKGSEYCSITDFDCCALQYCMMEHYTNNPLSQLCCPQKMIPQIVRQLSSEDVQRIQQLPSIMRSGALNSCFINNVVFLLSVSFSVSLSLHVCTSVCVWGGGWGGACEIKVCQQQRDSIIPSILVAFSLFFFCEEEVEFPWFQIS